MLDPSTPAAAAAVPAKVMTVRDGLAKVIDRCTSRKLPRDLVQIIVNILDSIHAIYNVVTQPPREIVFEDTGFYGLARDVLFGTGRSIVLDCGKRHSYTVMMLIAVLFLWTGSMSTRIIFYARDIHEERAIGRAMFDVIGRHIKPVRWSGLSKKKTGRALWRPKNRRSQVVIEVRLQPASLHSTHSVLANRDAVKALVDTQLFRDAFVVCDFGLSANRFAYVRRPYSASAKPKPGLPSKRKRKRE